MKNIVYLKFILISALFIILSFKSFAQTDSERIVATISGNISGDVIIGNGDEVITLNQYEREYLKTTANPDTAKFLCLDEKKNFLDLYINFRLKIKDAKSR